MWHIDEAERTVCVQWHRLFAVRCQAPYFPQDLQTPGLIFQIGVAPVRIDVITVIDGVEFEAAWRSRATARLGSVEVPVLSRRHLIVNKTKVGRKQDLADVEWLERTGGENRGS